MTEIFDKFFDLLIKIEGSYSDHKLDKGGKTKYGITKSTLKSYNMIENLDIKIEYMTKIEAKDVYKKLFYDKIKHNKDKEIRYLMFDLCVNSGYTNYLKCSIVCGDDKDKIYKWRADFYNNIVKSDASQSVFLKGWMNRLNKIHNSFNQ